MGFNSGFKGLISKIVPHTYTSHDDHLHYSGISHFGAQWVLRRRYPSDLSLVRINFLADDLQRGGGELLDAPLVAILQRCYHTSEKQK